MDPDVIVLSIDGENGRDVAQSRGLERIAAEAEALEQALVLRTEISRHGENGRHARLAIPGAPGGKIVFQVSEGDSRGRLLLDIREVEPAGALPRIVEIPVGRDVEFSVKGGDGEDGLDGGNGQDGMDGEDGIDASETVVATNGVDGGNGGNAGEGSPGGDGGPGGSIEIQVYEDQTHLLMPIKWDVSGGSGGRAGNPGSRGTGGDKGIGGKGFEWDLQVGYKYYCTNGCISDKGPGDSNRLVRYGSVIGRERVRLLTSLSTQTVAGTGSEIITALATRYAAARQPTPAAAEGVCHCHGGSGNCIGCGAEPVIQKCKRVAGVHGYNGMPGNEAKIRLHAGLRGREGKVDFVVIKPDDTIDRFSSLYDLELDSFDFEDENGDGVFEPGEHILVKRIKVRNKGGMPSPASRIPATFASSDSDWFIPVEGDEGVAFLPPSIPPGSAAIAEGYIKIRIRDRRDEEMQQTGEEFEVTSRIRIKATMPWIGRDLPNFQKECPVKIEFPCKIHSFHSLATIAQGASRIISFGVFNKGHTTLGLESDAPRPVEIDFSVHGEFGVLEDDYGHWSDSVTRVLPNIPANQSTAVKQVLRIHDHAPSDQHIVVEASISLGKPSRKGKTGRHKIVQVQRTDIHLQISDNYSFDEHSNFLLVTNSKSRPGLTTGIRRFIRDDLSMQVDTWNVGVYGGFQQMLESGKQNILGDYAGKAVVLLGNSFNFFEKGDRTVLDLLDPVSLAEALKNRTNFLFLETADFVPFDTLVMNSIFTPLHQAAKVHSNAVQSSRFEHLKQMTTTVHERQDDWIEAPSFSLQSGKKARLFSNPMSDLKRTAKYLQKNLSSERLLITTSNNVNTGFNGRRMSLKGNDTTTIVGAIGMSFDATLAAVQQTNINRRQARLESDLNGLEKYMIANTVPLDIRIACLWNPTSRVKKFVLEFMHIGIARLVVRETDAFLDSGIGLTVKVATLSPIEVEMYIKAHLPVMFAVLYLDPQGIPGTRQVLTEAVPGVPEGIKYILRAALASTTQQSVRQLLLSKHRKQLRKVLKAAITELFKTKSRSEEDAEAFFEESRNLLAKTDSKNRDAMYLITKDIGRLVKRSEHAVLSGVRDANDVVPRTSWSLPEKWDERVSWAETQQKKINEAELEAQKVLQNLVIGRNQPLPTARVGLHELDSRVSLDS